MASPTVGYIGIGLAVLFFGSNFIPIKKFETGDGMMFQFVVCIGKIALFLVNVGIWFVGLIAAIIRRCKLFDFQAILGGVIWTTGNLCTVSIVKCIGRPWGEWSRLGLARGLLVWGIANMITGWAINMFGWFGQPAEVHNVKKPVLNYLGVACCVLCVFISSFVKNDNEDKKNLQPKSTSCPSNMGSAAQSPVPTPTITTTPTPANAVPLLDLDCIGDPGSWVDNLSRTNKTIVGYALSVFAGIMYGTNFLPCNSALKWYPNATKTDMEFSQFCGIFVSSFVYFFVYCIYKHNRPIIHIRSVMPGFVSGMMWGVAQLGWFYANENLGEVVSYPIICCGPTIVSSIWGLTLYEEITGLKNTLLVLLLVIVMLCGSILVAVSKA